MFELNVWAIVSSLNQISNFSSNSQIATYLDESLACMVHFPFNHMNELELSYNYAKRHVKSWGRFVFAVI